LVSTSCDSASWSILWVVIRWVCLFDEFILQTSCDSASWDWHNIYFGHFFYLRNTLILQVTLAYEDWCCMNIHKLGQNFFCSFQMGSQNLLYQVWGLIPQPHRLPSSHYLHLFYDLDLREGQSKIFFKDFIFFNYSNMKISLIGKTFTTTISKIIKFINASKFLFCISISWLKIFV